MIVRSQIIRALLCLYPVAWRAEYGEELASLLSLRPIAPSVFVDVILSAARERFRHEIWKAAGVVLFVLTVLGIFMNNTTPLSREDYERYVRLWQIILLLTGCLTFLFNHRASPSWAAAKCALLGSIPEIIALTLWATRLFHPLVTKAAGPYPLLESRLALFDMTFPTAPQPSIELVPLATAFVLVEGCVFGFLGGLLGRTISFLSARLRPC